METHKTIDVSLNEAKEWYNSGNETLKELALKCFPMRKLNAHNFENIKTFEDAVNELGKDIEHANFIVNILEHQSKASAAMYKLNIVRKALNLGQDLHFTKNPEDSYIYHPYNPFAAKDSADFRNKHKFSKLEIIGKIKIKKEEHYVLGGGSNIGGYTVLGDWDYYNGIGYVTAAIDLGCASEEIAQHLSRYFGMLITEARFGDLDGFEIIERKYGNA